jgi:DNA repair exonuclease SbcCD ATPase subunit
MGESLTRYTNTYPGMETDPAGDWVDYGDHLAALTAARAELADRKSAYWQQHDQIGDLTAERNAARAEVAALAKERDEFRLRVEQWRDRCAEAQAQIGAARAEVAEADGVIAVWRRRTEQAEATAARLREAPAYADYYAACQCGHALNIHATSHGHPCRVEQCECRGYVNAALAAEEADRGE